MQSDAIYGKFLLMDMTSISVTLEKAPGCAERFSMQVHVSMLTCRYDSKNQIVILRRLIWSSLSNTAILLYVGSNSKCKARCITLDVRCSLHTSSLSCIIEFGFNGSHTYFSRFLAHSTNTQQKKLNAFSKDRNNINAINGVQQSTLSNFVICDTNFNENSVFNGPPI